MRTILTTSALVLALLALAPKTQAAEPQEKPRDMNHSRDNTVHGTKVVTGHKHVGRIYEGKNHHHWTYRYFWARYGVWVYFDPTTRGWYYWYAPELCYLSTANIASTLPAKELAPAGQPAVLPTTPGASDDQPPPAAPDAPDDKPAKGNKGNKGM